MVREENAGGARMKEGGGGGEDEDVTAYDTLVFSGGSTRAFAFVGCIRFLEERGWRLPPRNVIGCSAGALIAFMCTLGFRACEMIECGLTRMVAFGAHRVDPDAVFNFFSGSLGMDAGHRMIAFLEDLLRTAIPADIAQEACGGAEPPPLVTTTFAQLDRMLYLKQRRKQQQQRRATDGAVHTGADCAHAAPRLIVCASDLCAGEPRYFSCANTPHVNVITAVRASMCVPLLFAPVDIDGCLYVDGGLLENLPVGACVEPLLAPAAAAPHTPPRVLALNMPWENTETRAFATRDLLCYVWSLLSAMLKRTNRLAEERCRCASRLRSCTEQQEGSETHPETATVKVVDIVGIGNATLPFLGFSFAQFEFVMDSATVNEYVSVGYSLLRSSFRRAVERAAPPET